MLHETIIYNVSKENTATLNFEYSDNVLDFISEDDEMDENFAAAITSISGSVEMIMNKVDNP